MGCGTSKQESNNSIGGSIEGSEDEGGSKQKLSPQKSDKPKRKKGKLLQVLVAGYAQSGKSTFFKQLQIIHLNGWSNECVGPFPFPLLNTRIVLHIKSFKLLYLN